MPKPRRRRSQLALVLSGAVVILAGFAIAIVEAMHRPKGSIWFVVGAAIALVAAIRSITRN
jgi:membrane protein YdbS with pleckstrin-like domain